MKRTRDIALLLLMLRRTAIAFQFSTSSWGDAWPPTAALLPPSSYSCLNAQKKKSKRPARNPGTGFGSKPTPAISSVAKPLQSKETQLLEVPNTPAREERRQKWKSRTKPDVQVVDPETRRLASVFKEEYERLETTAPPRRLFQVSTSPLVFTIDEFIDPAMCERVQSDGSGCFDLLFPERVADLLFDGQESELDGLLFNRADSSQHVGASVFPDGLHMDTNGQVLFRHVTCILYLNTIEKENGGATVFPLARTLPDDPALVAAKHLIAEKVSHTRSPSLSAVPGASNAARQLEARVGSHYLDDPNTESAIRIQPKAGRLLIFFSRDEAGADDPRSWHAGERIVATLNGQVVEKRILTLFKQVDYAKPTQVQTRFEEYLAPQICEQRRRLESMARLKVPIAYDNLL